MTIKITKEIIENERLYACSICGVVYINENQAISCEQVHKITLHFPSAS